MKATFFTFVGICALALAAMAVDLITNKLAFEAMTSKSQTSAPEAVHLTAVVDEDGTLVGAIDQTGTPVPMQQLHEMMLSAVPPNWDNTVRWMRAGMWVMPKPPGDGGLQPTASQLIGHIASCSCDEDFPSIPAGYFKLNPNTCVCPGVRLGDKCSVGVLAATPSDGGSAFLQGAEVQAVARADNLVEIQIYNQLGDAGAMDPPDAGYPTTCFGPALN